MGKIKDLNAVAKSLDLPANKTARDLCEYLPHLADQTNEHYEVEDTTKQWAKNAYDVMKYTSYHLEHSFKKDKLRERPRYSTKAELYLNLLYCRIRRYKKEINRDNVLSLVGRIVEAKHKEISNA